LHAIPSVGSPSPTARQSGVSLKRRPLFPSLPSNPKGIYWPTPVVDEIIAWPEFTPICDLPCLPRACRQPARPQRPRNNLRKAGRSLSNDLSENRVLPPLLAMRNSAFKRRAFHEFYMPTQHGKNLITDSHMGDPKLIKQSRASTIDKHLGRSFIVLILLAVIHQGHTKVKN